MPAVRRLAAVLATGPVLLLAVTGCSGSAGQASALEACKHYTDATTGYVTPAARASALASAQQWAAKAANKAPQWQPLLQALEEYVGALHSTSANSATAKHLLADAGRAINASCESAAKGY